MMDGKRLLFGAIVASFMLLASGCPPVLATDEYKTGDALELLVTNATDGKLMLGKTCLITIFNQSVAVYTNQTMVDSGRGIYNFTLNASLVPQPNQPYKARVVCSIGTDWTDEMLFYVVAAHIPQSIASLPSSCGSGTSNLTVCGQGNSNLTACGAGSSNLTVCGQGSSNLTAAYVMTQANFTELFNGTLSQVQACGSGSSNVSACGAGASNLTDVQVWEYATRTLTQNITQNLTAEDIWTYATRTLTAFAFNVNVTDESLGNIATAVWTYATRELTGFGTLITDIWASATRTLTAVSITNATQTAQLANASANVTIGTTNNYNTDNSTYNIILPAEG